MLAVGIALAYGLLLYLLIWLTPASEGWLPFIAGLILMPMGIASIATAIADPRGEQDVWRHLVNGWLVISALVVISMLFFQEGGICVLMAAPCFAVGSTVGSLLTHSLLRQYSSRAPTSLVIALPLLALPLEPLIGYAEHHGAVTTVIEIAAPPATVWHHTVEIPDVRRDELPATFSHNLVGVPRPENASLQGSGIGAVRHLQWSQGVRFQEIVTAWEDDRYLAWDFSFGPQSIPAAVEAHIDVDSDYLKIASGDYLLEPLPDGGTRLTLTTRYTIATPINAYCDFWGRIFLNDFHSAVLQVIRNRAEAAV